MAKNVNHLQHVKSNVVVNNQPKLPGANVLVEGELAVNYATGFETISLKNNDDSIVRFSSDDYYTATKLGSGFTGANSANTVTSVIEQNELVISASLNDLETRKANKAVTVTGASGLTGGGTLEDDVVITHATAHSQSGKTSPNTNQNASFGDTVNIPVVEYDKYGHLTGTGTTTITMPSSASSWNAVTSVTTSSTSGSISVNGSNVAVHGLGTAAYRGVSNGITNSDNLIEAKHIYSGVGVTIYYDPDTKYMQLKNTSGNVISSFDASAFIVDGMVDSVELESKSGTTYLVITWNTAAGKQTTELNIGDIFEADNYYTATEIDDKLGSGFTGANSGRSVTEAMISNEKVMSAALNQLNTNKADLSALTQHAGDTTLHLSATGTPGTYRQVVVDQYGRVTSGNTSGTGEDTWRPIKINGTEFLTSGTTTSPLNLSGTSTVSLTTGATGLVTIGANTVDEITSSTSASTLPPTTYAVTKALKDNEDVTAEAYNDLNTRKLDASAFTEHTSNTSIHLTATEKENLDSLSGNIATLSAITSTNVSNWNTAYTNNHTHSNKTALDSITGNVGTMAYANTSSYSSATQVNTALAGKSDTSHTHVSSAVTAMTGYAMAASGTAITTSDTLNQAIGKLEKMIEEFKTYIEEKEEVIAAALNDLNDRLTTAEEIINNS